VKIRKGVDRHILGGLRVHGSTSISADDSYLARVFERYVKAGLVEESSRNDVVVTYRLREGAREKLRGF
jgi:hypothetical protein